jgi:guanine deaminase
MRLRTRTLAAGEERRLEALDDAYVEIGDGALVAVERYAGQPVDHDLRPAVLAPGFVDAHVHWAQTRIVGSASGPLLDWLARSTFPEEARFADPAHAEAVAPLFLDALARSGTTLALAYGPVFPEATEVLFRHAAARGQRLIAGPVLMDEHCPPELQLPADRALLALRGLAERWHRKQGQEVAVIPRFALCCSANLMASAAALARELRLRISTHLSENPVECRIATERFGAPDYLAVYERVGLVQPGAVFAHCVHVSDDEWSRLAAADAVVAHCPDSNDFLGSGGMPIDAWRRSGVRTAIGTDVGAGRSFRIPRTLSHAYDNALRQGVPLSEAELLWLATRGGALALDRAQTGLLAAGFDADLLLFRPPDWATTPEQALSSLLFDHDATPILATWVRGRQVHGPPLAAVSA